MGQLGFFDLDNLEAISAKGDPLEALNGLVPFESFRAEIEAVVRPAPEERKSNAGRKPFDAVMMFKVLVLQTLYNLADEQVEYQIRDRLSFMRFLDLGLLCRARHSRPYAARRTMPNRHVFPVIHGNRYVIEPA